MFSSTIASAQVAADPSLGTVVTPSGNFYNITGGTTVGNRNLFHSFSQFDVRRGEIANFVHFPTIANIFARVTGGNPSTINGFIATTIQGQLQNRGSANLFLMNPKGVIFNQNARLALGGSFVATTANAIQFPGGAEFSLTTPVAPTNPLLTVNPSALLFNRLPVAPIQSNAQLLAVPSGRSLLMVGGDISLNRSAVGVFQPEGGRVELGSVSGTGIVGLATTGNLLSLNFPDGLPRGDIVIANQSFVSVLAENAGSLTIHARNLDVSGQSSLLAGIAQGLGVVGNQAGDITLNATDAISIRESSTVYNLVPNGATGNSGNVIAQSRTLKITKGGSLGSYTSGQGHAGNVQVTADTITLDGTSPNGQFFSGISSEVESSAIGNGGNVTLQTGKLSITNGALVSTSTRGNGKAGNIQVTADTITLDGTSPNGQFSSGIVSEVRSSAVGNGGNVTLQTGRLNVTNGAGVSANTLGNGKAGNIQVAADTITLDGTSPNGQSRSGIVSEVRSSAVGNGGNVTLQTGRLNVTNGARVSVNTLGNGKAGNIQVTADTITLDGTSPNGQSPSAIVSEVRSSAIGNGGNVTLQTGRLNVTNGAAVSASTFGNGKAGNIQVAADTITLDGTAPNGQSPSGISSQVGPNAIGNGGNVTLLTGRLNITDGAVVSVSTFGNGKAGDVQVTADTITLDGTAPNGQFSSGIGSEVRPNAIGNGGNVTLLTSRLSITNGAGVSASAFGNGKAGSVQVTADTITLDGTAPNRRAASGIFTASLFREAGDIFITVNQLRLDNQAVIGAISAGADGGNITINIRDLLLMRHGSQISATAGIAQQGGDGGNITINAPRGFLVSAPNENNDITANAFSGSGGRITINAQGVYWFTPRSRDDLARLLSNPPFDAFRLPTNDITASSNLGVSGTVAINTLGIDPSRGLQQLPGTLVEPSQQIAQTCIPRGAQRASSFTVTGAGGLPPSPNEPLQSDAVIANWIPMDTSPTINQTSRTFHTEGIQTRTSNEANRSTSNPWIAEAQGWMIQTDGTVYLVSQSSSPSLNASPFSLPKCQ